MVELERSFLENWLMEKHHLVRQGCLPSLLSISGPSVVARAVGL